MILISVNDNILCEPPSQAVVPCKFMQILSNCVLVQSFWHACWVIMLQSNLIKHSSQEPRILTSSITVSFKYLTFRLRVQDSYHVWYHIRLPKTTHVAFFIIFYYLLYIITRWRMVSGEKKQEKNAPNKSLLTAENLHSQSN